MPAAEQQCALPRILEALRTRIFGREHDTPDLVRSQRVHRHSRRQGAVDSAGEAKYYSRKSVASDIVAQCDHHRAINITGKLIEFVSAPRLAPPSVGPA